MSVCVCVVIDTFGTIIAISYIVVGKKYGKTNRNGIGHVDIYVSKYIHIKMCVCYFVIV